MTNPYTEVVTSFMKTNPHRFSGLSTKERAMIARELAARILTEVTELTPALAETEMRPQMTDQQRQGITNMARLRAEEIAFHSVLYSLLETPTAYE
jgi:hypothetical protein